MSQAGKVLHLYVEVRSVAEEDGKVQGRRDEGTGHLMLQCPDVLPHSQRSSTRSSPSCSPDLSPASQHQTGVGNHSLCPSKSSSRHSVSFQLQNPDATGSPTQVHRQDVLYDSFGQLLQVLAPGITNSGHHGSLGQARSSDMDPSRGRAPISPSSTSSGRLTVPSTPTSNRRSYEDSGVGGEEGKTSVVTFGYIEKASVHSMGGRRTSVCQSELDNSPNRLSGQLLPAHLQKRLSDPVWYNGQLGQRDSYPSHPYLSQSQSPKGSPYMQRATLDAVARDATYRALEEFGSPELRRRFAGYIPENSSPTLPRHYQSPRCRSWAGSPVLPRSTLTLPSKTQLQDLDRGVCRSSVNGLPRSPASDHLCAHTGYSSHSVAPTSTLQSHGLPQSQQRPWVGDESPRLSSKFHPPLPAGRPTDIQHEIPTSIFPTSNYSRTGCQASGNPQHSVNNSYSANVTNITHNATDSIAYSANDNPNLPTHKTHYTSSSCSSRTSDAVSPTNGRRSISPSSNVEVACKLAVEAAKLSTVFADRRSPSPTPSQAESLRSESPKIGRSFLRESQPYATLHGQSSSEHLQANKQNHRWKTDKAIPQTRPGRVSPLFSQKGLSSPASPALPSRLHRAAASQSPVLDPRQQRSSSPTKDMSTLHRYQPPQYTGDHKSPGMEHGQYDHLFDRSPRDSPELSKKLLSNQNTEVLPVSWTSRHQEWREAGTIQHEDEFCEENYRESNSRVYTPNKEEYHRKVGGDKGIKMSVQGYQTPLIGVSKDQREEVQDHSGAAGTSSQSSSGVTGSMGDSSQLDRKGSLSPETLSQSSHDTADTGSGIQSDSGSVTTPSSRSQKIAQAKWEFLFGGQTEDSRCDVLSTTPPTSSSPSPTPPSSLHLKPANQRTGRDSDGQKLSHHEVQQIEVELVSPYPRGSAPKTGIIRQTIKYSETDLDAVPLRCYRETDLDEVMRAEAEAAEEAEADSAFGSNRSVLGNHSFSPADTSLKPRTGGGKEEEEEEDEAEEEEEEGVVSWASVRMLGDRQRQRATKEEDEVFSLLLKGSLEASSNTHGGLKSPISISSPRRPSDSNLDSFSRHFETIMESHRAKGTSYSSLDSVDLLTSGSTSVFTFDLPTLTPEIQSQICESAKQIIELSFAPLAHPDPSAPSETSRSELTLSASGAGLRGGSKDDSGPPVRSKSEKESWRRSILKDGFRKASSAPSLHSSPRSIRMMMMNSSEKMKKKPPKDSLTLLPCFYFVELPIVASSMVSLYFLELTDVVQPAQVGFRCHDRELSMPYVDGGDELIPLLMLLSLAFAGPAASIMLVEGLIYCLQSRLKLRRPEGSINAGGCNFNSFLRRTVRFVGVHVFGLCATALVTDIIQLSTGYHAPFFLTVCKPNYTLAGISCDRNAYITKDICSGHDQHAIMAARKTFPSQHATLSAFAAVYVSMYFNSTISDSTKLLKPVLVFAFAIAAALTGLTQITQHRSHPIDVYVGFLIGAFIAAYLAFHAVANFKSSDDIAPALPPPPPKEDPLRALTERGHESVYNKGPASASESNDEIAAAPAPMDRLEGLGPLQREKDSMGSLKRASVDVELLAPRSPMGKETMLTFSNTLPRASMNVNGVLGANIGPEDLVQPVQPVQPVQRRLKAVQVPMDPMRSQQLVSEWKQKSMEMRGLNIRDEMEREASEDGSEVGSVGTDEGGSQVPIYQPTVQSGRAASSRNPTPPPGGGKAVVTPRPPQIPEAGPPPVSPKSALTRAKWLAIREKTSGEGSARSAANQPRLMQVIAMSKQQGLLPSSSSGEKSSETTSTCSGTSSTTDSPHYRPTYEQREGSGIITVDAHAPHHPVVQAPTPPQAPPLAGNGNPWEWAGASNGSDPRDTYDLNSLNRGDSAASGSSFRPHRSASPRATVDPDPAPPPPHPQVEMSVDIQRREMAMRRKTALVLLDREIRNQTEQENYYKSLQGRRFKD